MTSSDNSLEKLMAEAEQLGKEQESIEERNRKRRAKGRKPLPDVQERKDMEVGLKRYRTGDSTTVGSADAIKLFELRKAEMARPGTDDPEDDDADETTPETPIPTRTRDGRGQDAKTPADHDAEAEAAIRAAESARRVQDQKNGRIDHAGNWSEKGQTLEGGDPTHLADTPSIGQSWKDAAQADETTKPADAPAAEPTLNDPTGLLEPFKKDLYARLGTSFEALERSLSDLQGRVAEILTATTPPDAPANGLSEDGAAAFQTMLEKKTPVIFNVGGTQMTFDAICVFSAPPCITLVSRIGSAKITPKPGAQLLLSYEMDGQRYTDDPVTFLGTRFDLPMFGLSFVGFIRDREADLIDAAAGVPPEGA